MPEDLAGLPSDAASPEGAAPADADIEKLRQEFQAAQAAFEDRFKGLQRVIGTKDQTITDLQRALDEAKLASLPDDERQAEVQRREASELDRLRAENELLRLMPDFPDELPIFQRLLGASDAKAQLELIRELRKPAAPATGAPAAPATEPAAVDHNNPASTLPSGPIVDGASMTDDLAERVLRSVTRLHG